jgi:hypothetical protein
MLLQSRPIAVPHAIVALSAAYVRACQGLRGRCWIESQSIALGRRAARLNQIRCRLINDWIQALPATARHALEIAARERFDPDLHERLLSLDPLGPVRGLIRLLIDNGEVERLAGLMGTVPQDRRLSA